MPKATNEAITQASPPAIVIPFSRRQALLGVALSAVGGSAVRAVSHDAKLIAACERFQTIFDRMQILNRHGCPDEMMAIAHAEWHAALASVVDAPPANGAAGVRARMLIARAIHRDRVTEHFWDAFDENATAEDLLIDAALTDALAGGRV